MKNIFRNIKNFFFFKSYDTTNGSFIKNTIRDLHDEGKTRDEIVKYLTGFEILLDLKSKDNISRIVDDVLKRFS